MHSAKPSRIHSKVVFDEDDDDGEDEVDAGVVGVGGEMASEDEGALDDDSDEVGDDDDDVDGYVVGGGDDESMADETKTSSASSSAAPSSAYNNDNPRQRALMKDPLNRSAIFSFQTFLKTVMPEKEFVELTFDEFARVLPEWIRKARSHHGGMYTRKTMNGYINALQRVVRTMQPHELWNQMRLVDMPVVKEAMEAYRLALLGETGGASGGAHPSSSLPSLTSPNASASSDLLRTRRAERLANGEVSGSNSYGHGYGYGGSHSLPSSASSSPRHGPMNGGQDVPPIGGHQSSSSSAQPQLGPRGVAKLSHEQFTFLQAQLDPSVPEGLFRLNWLNLAKHLGIVSLEDHRTLTLRNFLLTARPMKVLLQADADADADADVDVDAPEHDREVVDEEEAMASAPTAKTPETATETVAQEEASVKRESNAEGVSEDTNMATTVDATAPVAAPEATAATATQPTSSGDVKPSVDSMPSASPAPTTTAATASDDVEMTDATPSLDTAASAAIKDDTPTANTAASAPGTSSSSSPSTLLSSPPSSSIPPSTVPPVECDTPFEVCSPSDARGVWRLVKMLVFDPSSSSRKRPIGFMYERPWEGSLCPIALWSSYIRHRPSLEDSPNDPDLPLTLWLQPKRGALSTDSEWFNMIPVGRPRLSGLVNKLATGCGLPSAYSNYSITYQPAAYPPQLTSVELQDLRDKQRRDGYGLLTREQHALAQAAAILAQKTSHAAAAATATSATNNNNASSSASQPSSSSMPPPFAPSASSTHPPAPLPFSMPPSMPMGLPFNFFQPSYFDPTGRPMYVPFPPTQPPSSVPPSSSSSSSFFLPSSSDPSHFADHLSRSRLFNPSTMGGMGMGTGAGDALGADRDEKRLDGNAPTSGESSLPGRLVPTPLSSTQLDSHAELLDFIDRMQDEMTTLTNYAARCQKSLTTLKSFSSQLRTDRRSQLQLSQYRARIATQHQLLEEQQYVIAKQQELLKQHGIAPPASVAKMIQTTEEKQKEENIKEKSHEEKAPLESDGTSGKMHSTSSPSSAAPASSSPTAAAGLDKPSIPSVSTDATSSSNSSITAPATVEDEDDDDLPPLVSAPTTV